MAEWVRSEFILGGQRSGKSGRAEAIAARWLGASAQHRALLIATARARDAEMQARIARHRAERAQRVPGLATVEVPLAVADALRRHATPQTLVVIDCLTLWLTNLMLPLDAQSVADDATVEAAGEALCAAIAAAPGPVVVVSNEIGLGVIPLGAEVRAFVDALGRLNRRVAATCARVTWMAAGLPLTLKGQP